MAGKVAASLCTCRKECNKYDLTATQCVSDLPIIMIGPGGLLLVVSHLFAIPASVLWVGLQKSTYIHTYIHK
jgi:hypothetical protein